MASGIEETLTHGKIGGVPVWGVGVGLAGVFVAFQWWRGRNSAVTRDPGAAVEFPEGDIAPEGAAYGLPPGPIGDWLSQNPTFAGYPVGYSLGGLPSAITNGQWARLVTDELLSQGADPTLVSNALTKYLSGQSLTASEQAVINKALQILGTPPEGILPINTTPDTPDTPDTPPDTPDTTPPTSQRYFTVTIPKNVKQIAKQVYGNDNWNGAAGRLYWANEYTIVSAARAAGWNLIPGNGDQRYADFPLPPGTKLVLP